MLELIIISFADIALLLSHSISIISLSRFVNLAYDILFPPRQTLYYGFHNFTTDIKNNKIYKNNACKKT
ncbi:hypothetical protein Aargi30884_08070 [Amedibacterium intestinale]|uniref:Uncharacterized protein n=1 Tax=Amedibacterium intestinale TaxID=2583452 RepID=A0A6N4THF6_9FIRM|nr:hypothetical protein Aargi30884_08070 [Amedibacterium intestinale]